MFLSFIVPVYNVEKYLDACLLSLLDQDIPPEEYEIICVNDGSTDGSLEILRRYEVAYSNVCVIDQKNSGVATARNTGLDVARGEYVWFVDSDDFIRHRFLPTLYWHILKTNAERVKVGTYVINGEMTESEAAALEKNELEVNSHFYDSMCVTCVLQRNFLRKHGCRFQYPALTHGEDSIFMFEVVANNPQCTELDIPIYFYRHRPGSATTSEMEDIKKRKLISYLCAAEIMKKHYDDGVGNPRETANLLMSYIWYVMDGCATLSGKESRMIVSKMRLLGLYPFYRPTACTHMRSYQTTRTDIVGRIFDKVYINTHRPWGFAAMKLLRKIIDLKNRLVN